MIAEAPAIVYKQRRFTKVPRYIATCAAAAEAGAPPPPHFDLTVLAL